MLKLNIIPPALKKELNLKLIYIFIKNFLFTSSAVVLIYASVFLFSRFILQSNFIDTVNQSTLVTRNIKNYNNQISTINEQLNSISVIQKGFIKWSDLINFLSLNLNDGIRLNQLKLDSTGDNMQISGVADTRESLLKFKDALDNNENLSDISFPIKNLLEKNNISFEISAKIKNYEFK